MEKNQYPTQGLVKGAVLCIRNLYFYFRHGGSTSTASQKSKDLNKVSLLLQDLELSSVKDHWLPLNNPPPIKDL